VPELPSGTVTFLFTDIERSTESAAALGDERWAEALQTHRDLLRPAFEKHGGVEVGTEGDSFFVAFARARDAVGAAIDGQRSLESHAWPGESRLRVRMGLHTGEALVRGDGYVGHEIHRAKRISDAAHGGQILLSQTTADLLHGSADLVDLGPHRLKDLGEPQRLYQLTSAGLLRDFPPLRGLDAFTHSLPLQRSAFIGREKEIAEIVELVSVNRIITLTT
jgi:class 3 adenylate cyclase